MEYIGYKDPIGNGQYNMGFTDTEIIRCRDCRYFKIAKCKFASKNPNKFCAWAKRRKSE